MLKNKSIIILLIIFSLFLSSCCYATITFNNNDIEYIFPNSPYNDRPYFISTDFENQDLTILVTCRYSLDELKEIYDLSDDKDYKLIYSMRFTENMGNKYVFSWLLVSLNENGTFNLVKDLSDSCNLWLNQVYILSEDSTTWVLKENKGYLGIYYAQEKIIYSNFDIYNGIDINNVFFYRPPQGIISPIVEEMEMKITLQEIIKILPLIIAVVVSLVGLRKALQMLSALLRRCLIILIHLVKNLF